MTTFTDTARPLSGVEIHPWLAGARGLEQVLLDPTSLPIEFACWGLFRGIDILYREIGCHEPLFDVSLTPGNYERYVNAARVVELVAPILERPELAWVCGTCGAQVGQACRIRDPRYIGSSHRPRIRKFERYQVRAEARVARLQQEREYADVV